MTKNQNEVELKLTEFQKVCPDAKVMQYVDYGVKLNVRGAICFIYYKPKTNTYRLYIESSPTKELSLELDKLFYHMDHDTDELDTAYVYVDGSCCKEKNQVGWAYGIYYNGKKIALESGLTSVTEFQQVAGELTAIMRGLNHCKKLGYSKVKLFYDYEGGYKWVNGDWKANNTMAKTFTAYTQSLISFFTSMQWIHVKAHTGNYRNEEVDKASYLAAKI